MKKVIGLCLLAFVANGFSPVLGQESRKAFQSLAVGVGVGSLGVGLDVATPLSSHFTLRGGVNFIPNIKIKTDVEVSVDNSSSSPREMEVTGEIGRVSGELLVNYYPFQKLPFFVAAGAYFGGSELVKASGHDDKLGEYIASSGKAGIVLGDKILPVDPNGNVSGGLKVWGARPYLGIGYGNAIPYKRLGFMVELGAQFHGSPDLFTDYGTIANAPHEGSDNFLKVVEKVTVYPVLKFRLSGRIL